MNPAEVQEHAAKIITRELIQAEKFDRLGYSSRAIFSKYHGFHVTNLTDENYFGDASILISDLQSYEQDFIFHRKRSFFIQHTLQTAREAVEAILRQLDVPEKARVHPRQRLRPDILKNADLLLSLEIDDAVEALGEEEIFLSGGYLISTNNFEKFSVSARDTRYLIPDQWSTLIEDNIHLPRYFWWSSQGHTELDDRDFAGWSPRSSVEINTLNALLLQAGYVKLSPS